MPTDVLTFAAAERALSAIYSHLSVIKSDSTPADAALTAQYADRGRAQYVYGEVTDEGAHKLLNVLWAAGGPRQPDEEIVVDIGSGGGRL
eukprot:5433607-Prymnesium_polylepis.1